MIIMEVTAQFPDISRYTFLSDTLIGGNFLKFHEFYGCHARRGLVCNVYSFMVT